MSLTIGIGAQSFHIIHDIPAAGELVEPIVSEAEALLKHRLPKLVSAGEGVVGETLGSPPHAGHPQRCEPSRRTTVYSRRPSAAADTARSPHERRIRVLG